MTNGRKADIIDAAAEYRSEQHMGYTRDRIPFCLSAESERRSLAVIYLTERSIKPITIEVTQIITVSEGDKIWH